MYFFVFLLGIEVYLLLSFVCFWGGVGRCVVVVVGLVLIKGVIFVRPPSVPVSKEPIASQSSASQSLLDAFPIGFAPDASPIGFALDAFPIGFAPDAFRISYQSSASQSLPDTAPIGFAPDAFQPPQAIVSFPIVA